MDQIPAAMDRHLDVVQCHRDGGLLLGASSLTGRYWLGSLWFYQNPALAPDVEKCTAGVQLEAGLRDAKWAGADKVLVGLDTGGVAIWQLTDDFRTFELSCSALEHDDIVSSVTVTADGTKAVSGGYDGMIKLWDLDKLSSLNSCRVHYDIIWTVECHPTETDLFLSCSQDGQVLVWDCRNARPAVTVGITPLEGSPTCVSWQPGSQHVAAISNELGQIIVKDIRMNKESPTTTFSPHSRFVYKTEFCPGKPNLLASVGEDCRTVVTDIHNDTASQVYSEVCHTDFVHGLTWSGTDSLYTCGWDSQIKLHRLNGVVASEKIKQESVVMAVNGEIPENCAEIATDTKPCYSQVVQGTQQMKTER